MNRVLIVDIDLFSKKSLCDFLTDNAYEVMSVSCIADAIPVFEQFLPRIVILERELPDGSGLSLAKYFYDISQIGTIIYTHYHTQDALLSGLRHGVDYYLSKDVSHQEILCYINNLIRRVPLLPAYRSSWFCSDHSFSLTSPNGKMVKLTPTELVIICLFSKRNETLLTRDAFALALHKMNVQGFDKNLKVVINRMKKKVLEETGIILPIVSVRNVGYEFRGILSSFFQED